MRGWWMLGLLLGALGGCHRPPSSGRVAVWEPMDPTFTGCAGG
jgi:hypothetical protein